MEKYIKITQIKSAIGRLPKHKTILQTLGLRRIGQSVTRQDTIANRGMVNYISYMLKVDRI